MCYVGKATKIFIFIVTVLAVTGLVIGFGLLRHSIQKTHKCSGDSCLQPPSSIYPDPSATPTPFLTPNPNPTPIPNPNPNPNPNPSPNPNPNPNPSPNPNLNPPPPPLPLSPTTPPPPAQTTLATAPIYSPPALPTPGPANA